MAEQSGRSVAALRARSDDLARRHHAIVEADRRLAEAVSVAHTTAGNALAALDRIESEIEAVVAANAAPETRTSYQARELQRFLIDKQREILAVLLHARDLAAAKTTVIQEIANVYQTPGDPSRG